MKIEQVLVHYLLKNKQLTLQGIGTFHLDPAIPDSMDSDKPIILPENAVTFHYDPKVTEDEGLVDFIVEHTKKIKPLAASDLDSYLSLGRQFLNIGKPFNLPNIGTLEKLNSGKLDFKPGQLIAERLEPNKIKSGEGETVGQEENLFNDYQKERKSNNAPKIVLILVILLVLAFIVWAVWHYGFTPKTSDTVTSTEQIVPVTDSSSKKDSAITASPNTSQRNPADSFTFKVVVNEYRTKDAAVVRLQKLKKYGRNVIMYTDDSVIYKIAEPFMLPLSDTSRVLNSLKHYYARPHLEIK